LSNIDTIRREVAGAGVEVFVGGLKGRRNPIDRTRKMDYIRGLTRNLLSM
jgi:hypothetical protein